MKKIVNRTLKWILVSFICITTFNSSIFAEETTTEREPQEVLETQESNMTESDEKEEVKVLSDVKYKELNEQIVKKEIDEETLNQKSEDEIRELEKNLPYELKLLDLENTYTKTQLNDLLPKFIAAQIDNEEIEIPITWKLDDIDEEIKEGIYTLTPKIPEEYIFSEDVPNNNIELTISYKVKETENNDQNAENELRGLNKDNDLINISDNNIVTGFDIKWVNAGNAEIDDTEIEMKAEDNLNETKVRAQLNMEVSQANIDKGQVQIRLPAKLFTNRDGEKQGYSKVGILDNSSYEYKEDVDNNEIIITNNKTITEAHALMVQIDYYDAEPNDEISFPSQIINNSTHDLIAQYSINLGKETISGRSKKIQVKHIIDTKLSSVNKQRAERVLWDSSWGKEPENSIFVEYSFEVRLAMTATMPYRLTLKKAGSYIGLEGTKYDGKVVYNAIYHVKDNIEITSIDDNNSWIIENIGNGNIFGREVYVRFVVAYPKDTLGKSAIIDERLTATLTPFYEDDGEKSQARSNNLRYQYETLEFKYPPGNYSIKKGNSKGNNSVELAQGAIDKINLVDDDTTPIKLPGYTNVATVEGGELTLKEDGDKNNVEDYEQREYTMEAYDDLMILNGERLVPGDYSFPSVTIGGYKYYTVIENELTGGAEYEEVLDNNEKKPIKIYYSKSIDNKDDWIEYATVTVNQDNDYTVTYNDGKKATSRGKVEIQLPEHTVGVKAITTSKRAKTVFDLDVAVNLYGTAHLKQIMKDLETSNKTSIDLYNVSTIVVKDSDGKWVNASTPSSITGSLEPIVSEHDKKIYEGDFKAQHDDHTITLRTLTKRSLLNKKITDFKYDNDITKKYFHADCLIASHNSIEYSDGVITRDDVEKYNLIPEESHGKIYDLLPMGAYVQTSSVKAGYSKNDRDSLSGGNISSFVEIKDSVVSMEYINNWKKSGRTLVIFDITTPEEFDNIYQNISADYFDSSLAVQFKLIYPLESLTDYGMSLRNLAAYESDNELFNGLPDNCDSASFNETEKEWFKDINNDGIFGDSAPKNMLYATCDKQLSDPIAAEFAFKKHVKNNSDVKYDKNTTILPREKYSYQLRIGNANNSETKNNVIFDVLETAYKDGESWWQGTLDNVDVSQPILNGVEPVIYYSVKEDIKLNYDDVKNLSGNANISDPAIWTTKMPDNKESITAVAVDLRYDSNGQEFVLKNDRTLVVILNMEAPRTNLNDYLKNEAKAYNEAWLSNDEKLPNTSDYDDKAGLVIRTEVSIEEPVVEIDKTSDPKSGTETKPTLVKNEDSIVYDVAVYNREQTNSVYDIVVEDKIPDGLSIDFDNIKYYYKWDKENAKLVNLSDDGISADRDSTDPQKLIFKIDELKGLDNIHFLIPTKVDTTDKEDLYVNQAFITEIDGIEYIKESPKTYHKKKVSADFDFIKKNKQGNVLEGAKFVLYELNCKDESHDHKNKLIEVNENGDLVNPSECFKNAKKSDSLADGSVHFDDLKINREYRLIEYQAPSNYVVPEGQWVVTYDESTAKFKVSGSLENPPAFEVNGSDLIVRNYKLEELPSTGGRGWTRYMLFGAVVMCIGGVWIYRNKKRKMKRL